MTKSILKTMTIVGAFALAAGCSDKQRDEQAKMVKEQAEQQASAIKEQGKQQAEALKQQAAQLANPLENKASDINKKADEQAQAVKESGELEAESIQAKEDSVEAKRKSVETEKQSGQERAGQVAQGDDLVQVQKQLKDRGLYKGQLDGIMGKQTQQSLRAFQESESIDATGRLDSETRSRLMQSAGKSGE